MGSIARVESAPATFEELIGRFGKHAVASGEYDYIQPYVYLSLHVVQMRIEGWDVDFDRIAAVSGASALYAYEAGAFEPKYAHRLIPPSEDFTTHPPTEDGAAITGIDQRIAAATGFGYEWITFDSPEDAWNRIRHIVDNGHIAKGEDWEGILFGGYRDTTVRADRWIFAMADGPDTYSRWLSWEEFTEWANRVAEWGQPKLGYFTGQCEVASEADVARRVLRDLVAWSSTPPDSFKEAYPEAKWGLEGIDAYADDCANVDRFETWVACHDINPQWTIRNATAVYLDRIADNDVLGAAARPHLRNAAAQYRAAYSCWEAFYRLLGHGIPEQMQRMRRRREAGAAIIRAWRDHETTALEEVAQVLKLT